MPAPVPARPDWRGGCFSGLTQLGGAGVTPTAAQTEAKLVGDFGLLWQLWENILGEGGSLRGRTVLVQVGDDWAGVG